MLNSFNFIKSNEHSPQKVWYNIDDVEVLQESQTCSVMQRKGYIFLKTQVLAKLLEYTLTKITWSLVVNILNNYDYK